MAAEAVDFVARRRRVAAHISSIASARSALDERRDGAVEDDRQARVLDVPAHDPQRVGPQLLGRAGIRARLCSPLVTTAAAAPSPNRAVATTAAGSSLSSRIEIEQVSTVTNSQLLPGSAAAIRAAIDRPLTPPAQPRPNTGTRRMSLRKPTRRDDARFQAGRGDAGGRDGDDAVDLVGRQPRLVDRRGRRFDEQLLRPLPDRRRCGHASRAAVIPFGRRDQVAPGDPGIVEHAGQSVEQAFLPPKRARGRAPSPRPAR